MKKRFIFFTLLLLTLVGGVKFNVLNAQETVTIGENGTLNTYYAPNATAYAGHSVSQQLYLKDEIGKDSGWITSISFKQNSNGNSTRNLVIYMKNVEKKSYDSTTDWVEVTDSDIVFSGEFAFDKNSEGWTTIELNNLFKYEGNDIAITVNDITGNKPSVYDTFYAFQVSSLRGLYRYNAASGASPYDCSNLGTGNELKTSQYATPANVPIVNNIKLTFGNPPSAEVQVTPKSIALGNVRLGDDWTEKPVASANVEIKAIATTITSISCNNNFFTLNYDLDQNPVALNVSYNKEANDSGAQSGDIKITSADCDPVIIPVTATAYEPANGDIVEKAIEVKFTDNAFSHSATGMYDDYILPGEAEDGNLKDAVYKFELEKDALITATVDGTNPIVAIYNEDFGEKDGPSSDNNNKGVAANNGPQELDIIIGDGSSNTSAYIPTDEYYGYTISQQIYTSEEMNVAEGLVKTIAFKKADATAATRKISIYMSNTDKANFSSASDWVSLSSENLVYEGYVTYPTNSGEWLNFELSTPFEYEGNNVILCVVDNTKTWGTAVNFYAYKTDEADGYRSLFNYRDSSPYDVSNPGVSGTLNYYLNNTVKFSGEFISKTRSNTRGAQIDGVQYPGGSTYYLVAAAEGDFTLNLSTASLPAPKSFAYTAPENNTIVEETNPELSWESAKYASSYDVYLGTTTPLTKVATDITATSFQTEDLSNNTKYYWQVVAKNVAGNTAGEVYSFVTPLDIPQNVTASSNEIYPDNNNVTITWNAITGVKGYNVYVKAHGEGNAIDHNGDKLVTTAETTASYALSNMDYSLNGHVVYVTAVYDIEGVEYESNMSAEQTIKVTGYGKINGTITDANSNGIDGVNITVTGTDEFGIAANYTTTTDKNGAYSIENVLVGTYSLTASRLDYKTYTNPSIEVQYNVGYNGSFSLESNPSAPFAVNAEEGRASWYANYTLFNVYRRDSEGVVKPLATEVKANEYQDTEWETLAEGEYEYGVSAMVNSPAEIMREGFDNGLPNGWSSPSTYYYISNSNYGYMSWGVYNNEVNIGARANNYTISLSTSEIDLSESSVSSLKFDYKTYDNSGKVNTLYVKVKAEGESSWTTVGTIKDIKSAYTTYEISLNSYVGKKIQISFDCYTSQYAYTYIDNVVVTGTTLEESRINWSAPIAKKDYNTYTGTGEWNVATNWSKGIPTEESEVLINGSVTIPTDSEITVASMKINSGKSLTISNGASLTVTGLLESTHVTRLVILDGGQLFQTNPEVQASFNMSIVKPKEEEWSENNINGWQFIASPFIEKNNNNINSFAKYIYYDAELNEYQTDYDLYKYDGSQEGEEWRNHKRVNFTSFESGVGYLASQKDRESVNFIGTLNPATSFSKEFSYNDANNGDNLANFYLLGNPFTFDMDINNASFTNMVNGIAVVTSQGGYDYKQTKVPVGNGFFVQATGEATGDRASFSYTHNARSSQETANSINVIASGKAGEDNVVVNFAGQAQGFNKLQNFNDAIATVYVSENGKNYGIANVDENTTEVALNFDAKEMGSYTISLDINGEFETVTLVDRFTGVETDMLVENEYSFIASADDNVNRFVIRLGNGQEPTANSQFVYQNGEELILSIEGSVQIVDMLGRVVYSNEHADAYNRINVAEFKDATYVVRVVNEEGVKVQKVVIY